MIFKLLEISIYHNQTRLNTAPYFESVPNNFDAFIYTNSEGKVINTSKINYVSPRVIDDEGSRVKKIKEPTESLVD